MSDRDRFQGKCLQNSNGVDYMTPIFDKFSPKVRERLRNSPYNLCAACVNEISVQFRERKSTDYAKAYEIARLRAIEAMENQIRCEEVSKPRRPDPLFSPAELLRGGR